MSLTLVSSERFAEHRTPPGHPERAERAGVMDTIASRWRSQQGAVASPRAATLEELARVHAPEYLSRIAATSGRAVALDSDTYASPETHEIALLAAGAAIEAVEIVMGGGVGVHTALAMVRPPGHHAERSRAMGFCFYNNVAVAAAHARSMGARRVAIVDYDVHHGNGTQHIFEVDPSVLYLSIHQFPFYPGTGAAEEIGREAGRGFTVNLPVEAGAVDEDYQLLFTRMVGPVLRQFAPDLLIVSAGFDAHLRDPLAGMRLTTGAFAAMTMELRIVAEEVCGGRIALVTEGGYDLEALEGSLAAVVDSLSGPTASPVWPSSGVRSTRGETSAVQAARALASFWSIE